MSTFNTLRLEQNGRHFADDSWKDIFFNENIIYLVLNFTESYPSWLNSKFASTGSGDGLALNRPQATS